VVALVDLDRAAVGIFDDQAAPPRHLLVPTEHACGELTQRTGRAVQGVDEETRKRAPTAAPRRGPAGGLRGIDRKVNRSESTAK
jgi:hypothetical protein